MAQAERFNPSLLPSGSRDWPSANPLPIPSGRFIETFPVTSSMVKGSSWDIEDFTLNNSSPADMEYILIRLPRRGPGGSPMTFSFMVNPSSIHVNYTTVDSQSMVRSGWTFGVWGDNMIEITMEGSTGGYYFANGLEYSSKENTLAYRNLMSLMAIVCNNGNWFEGEEMGSANDTYARMRIKSHEDVQLIYNNFIWYGMFTALTVSETADTPYRDTFSLSFTAWKERFRSSSPNLDSVHNGYRGHTLPPLPPKKEETPQEPTIPYDQQAGDKAPTPSAPIMSQKGMD